MQVRNLHRLDQSVQLFIVKLTSEGLDVFLLNAVEVDVCEQGVKFLVAAIRIYLSRLALMWQRT